MNAMFTLKCSPFECVFYVVAIFGGIVTIAQIWLVPKIEDLPKNEISEANVPVILWWTSSFGEDEQYRNCGEKRCYFTKKRFNALHPLLEAILFYGSNVELKDLPIPRARNVKWALLHEESPRNNPMFVYTAALELFNYSATFSRYSDVPLLTLPEEEAIISTAFYLPLEEKNKLIVTKKLAPLLYIQTDCDTPNDRDSYVAELMKYIDVDSYGACLNNRRLPDSLRVSYLDKLESDEFLSFVAQYKFTLAFENAVCDDYITEKLWRPLIVGSVPVYYGSPTFKDWLPNNSSSIAVQDFPTPKELANFLIQLNTNDEQYEQYLTHKLSNPETSISNDRLLNALRSGPNNLYRNFGDSVRAFQCFVCEKLHDKQSIKKMSQKEYNCSAPKSMLPETPGKINSWSYQWEIDQCNAKLLAQHVSKNVKIEIKNFTNEALRMYENRECL